MNAEIRQAADAGPPIPFRAESNGGSADGMHALMVTVLLLCMACAVLWTAKRRGLIERWIVPRPAKKAEGGLILEQTLRLSPKTSLYVLGDGADRHFVIESTVHARIQRQDKSEVDIEH